MIKILKYSVSSQLPSIVKYDIATLGSGNTQTQETFVLC